ncbi:sigma 54-interacting transcriptional regulator [Youngiibacter fragilis]|uniref:Diguanylate cyclase n=1 Tax=Youngiibacter fragilis 232.1 TaxID=994573 RepID=V7I6R6_9CLOT|nr:sigma 54-interacting transcriptional regulator [Youngiibacter fragilis]ETA81915.1 diguanylate cyclase [Youngiibacter fragilis 232.1]
MKVRLGFISYGGLTDIIRKIEGKYKGIAEFYITHTPIENVVDITRKFQKENKLDIVLSAGANGFEIKKAGIKPYVDISPTITDFLFSVKRAKLIGGDIAIVSYHSRMPYLEELKSLINVTIHERTYSDFLELEDIVRELVDEGITNVIGSSLVREKGDQYGLNTYLVYSESSVEEAIDEAISIALALREKDRQNERLKAMMNFTYEGIIATDKNGVIEIFNKSAERISGIYSNQAIGNRISDIIPNTRLEEVIASDREELNQTQLIGEYEILTNRVPIKIKDDVVGAIATFQTVNTIQEAEEKLRRRLNKKGFTADTKFEDMIGKSQIFKHTVEKAKLYARTNSTILLYGESGTGKELFAQSIHNYSLRANRPFVAINCGALPENILESELFGYEEGAFTGSKKGGKQGVFELAHNGTIFLDEIGELSMSMQTRLLRVLENREVMRLGGESIISVDVRIITATNKKLRDLVREGKFRHDLYFRICVLELFIPSLTERKDDIPILIESFLKENNIRINQKKLDEIRNHEAFTERIWEGNIRELKNVIERFSVLFNNSISLDNLIIDILYSRYDVHSDNEQNAVYKVIQECGGNKSEAAKKLGISRTTLWRLLNGQK